MNIFTPYLVFFLIFTKITAQNGNQLSFGVDINGYSASFVDDSIRDIYYLELTPSLGFQVKENLYVYITYGRSYSNFLRHEVRSFGLITRKYLKRMELFHFYLGHHLSITNISYKRENNNIRELTNNKFTGFNTGIEAGANVLLYKNLSIILNVELNYRHGLGIKYQQMLSTTFQWDIHTSKKAYKNPSVVDYLKSILGLCRILCLAKNA